MTALQARQPQPQPLPCETLSEIWFRLHADAPFAVSRSESHYLRALAVALDDDNASLLLLKKLRLAAELEPADLPPGLVVMNSFVEFTFGGGEPRFCQIVHGSAVGRSFSLAIDTRLGTGLIGLRSGQTILWPNAQNSLQELHVVRVENCPGMGDWLRAAA